MTALAAAPQDPDAVAAIRSQLAAGQAPPKDSDPVCAALAALDALPGMLELHRQRGIPEAISRATAADLALWMCEHHRRHGTWGLSEAGWLRHHLSGRLLRLGRLQFMLATCWLKDLRPGDPLRHGEAILDVHIPAGEPLLPEACLDSFAQAAACFAEQDWKGFFCSSWLLAPRLAEVVPPTSNILAFQRMFQPLPSAMDDRQSIERIFGSWPLDAATAPRKTSLQQAVLAFYAAGHRLDGGAGFRTRSG